MTKAIFKGVWKFRLHRSSYRAFGGLMALNVTAVNSLGETSIHPHRRRRTKWWWISSKQFLCRLPPWKDRALDQRPAGWFSIPTTQIGLTLIADASWKGEGGAVDYCPKGCSSDNDEQLEEYWCLEWKLGNLLYSFTFTMVLHIQNPRRDPKLQTETASDVFLDCEGFFFPKFLYLARTTCWDIDHHV